MFRTYSRRSSSNSPIPTPNSLVFEPIRPSPLKFGELRSPSTGQRKLRTRGHTPLDHGQNAAALFERIKQLEQQHRDDSQLISDLYDKIDVLEKQLDRMKGVNRQLQDNKVSTGEIHEIYKDLYSNEITQQRDNFNNQVSQARVNFTEKQLQLDKMKKEKGQVEAKLKQYKAFLTELSSKNRSQDLLFQSSPIAEKKQSLRLESSPKPTTPLKSPRFSPKNMQILSDIMSQFIK